MFKSCKICGDTFDTNGRGETCSPECSTELRVKWHKENRRVAGTPKPCKGCKVDYMPIGNTLYCETCREANAKELATSKVDRSKICKTCTEPIIKSKTYCDACRKQRAIDSMRKQTADRQEARGAIKDKPIDPRWLTRGAI